MAHADAIITPWEVKGDIDYDKVIKEFGVTPFHTLPKVFQDNVLFRRGIIFAQRDFGQIIKAHEEKKPFVMMSGLMPTGKFHIGHMILAQQFVFYQKLGAKIYIAVADIEAYNARGQSLEESRKIALDEYIVNYIALGLKPEHCEIYFQSDRSSNAKKANSYYRLQNILAHHATFNEFKAVYGEITPGKMLSALLQASDMLHPKLQEFEGDIPVLVPVGIDQDPHIRLARDIAARMPHPKLSKICSTYHRFMMGLSGGKMSSSDPTSFIALTDDEKTVKNKINKYAFSGGKDTVEEHRKHGGNPDVDVAFQYLYAFFEPDDDKIKQLHDDYKKGKLLSGEMKKIAIDKINAFLAEHQKKLEHAKNKIDEFIRSPDK